jgi:hypothetical protein
MISVIKQKVLTVELSLGKLLVASLCLVLTCNKLIVQVLDIALSQGLQQLFTYHYNK